MEGRRHTRLGEVFRHWRSRVCPAAPSSRGWLSGGRGRRAGWGCRDRQRRDHAGCPEPAQQVACGDKEAVAISPSDLCAFDGARDFSPRCVLGCTIAQRGSRQPCPGPYPPLDQRSPERREAVSRYLYCEVGDLAASNIFFRPSIPDMASTFFLQSPTSTGRSCGQTTHTSETHWASPPGGSPGDGGVTGHSHPRNRSPVSPPGPEPPSWSRSAARPPPPESPPPADVAPFLHQHVACPPLS